MFFSVIELFQFILFLKNTIQLLDVTPINLGV